LIYWPNQIDLPRNSIWFTEWRQRQTGWTVCK